MRIYVAYNGKFGERVIGHLINYKNFCISCDKLCIFCRDDKTLNFADNIMGIYTQPSNLPVYIEDPTKYMPISLPENDVMLAINLHPDIISEFPNIAKNAGTRLIIAPIEEPNWLSTGLSNQIKEKCEKLGIIFVAPKPFCSLKKGNDPLIDRFIEYFKIGFPRLKIGVKNNNIATVQVLCSQPCGCAYYVAQKLKNTPINDKLDEIISNAHHAYPCTASMERDTELKDTILHKAGYNIREAVHNALSIEDKL
jgi:thymidylate synthase